MSSCPCFEAPSCPCSCSEGGSWLLERLIKAGEVGGKRQRTDGQDGQELSRQERVCHYAVRPEIETRRSKTLFVKEGCHVFTLVEDTIKSKVS